MKRPLILLFVALTALLPAAAREVFLFTIDEEISASAWRNTRRAIDEAQENADRYSLFMLNLNTYGGEIDMADSIRTALMSLNIPTAVYIDHNAASAGALISLACDTIIMASHATIGAASVVNGAGEIMPPKFQSYWSSIMRATAMSHGKYLAPGDSVARWRRDPAIAAEMVNPEKAISLTASEALECGISDFTADNLHDALEYLDLGDAKVVKFEPTLSDRLLGFLASAGVRAILITLILGGLYMEMHTPGLGFAAAVSICAAVLYFLPMIATGSMPFWILILFVLGVILFLLELFVIPGFGIAGISGILCIIVAIVGAMLDTDSIIGGSGTLAGALATLGIGIALAVVLVWYLTSRHGPECFRRVATLTREQRVEDGYVGVDMAPGSLIGSVGVAETDLRPAGKVSISGVKYDASSTGEFIPAGRSVKVVRYEAAQIYVEPRG